MKINFENFVGAIKNHNMSFELKNVAWSADICVTNTQAMFLLWIFAIHSYGGTLAASVLCSCRKSAFKCNFRCLWRRYHRKQPIFISYSTTPKQFAISFWTLLLNLSVCSSICSFNVCSVNSSEISFLSSRRNLFNR